MSEETRELLVFGVKTFKITIPADYKITFGPFSPPTSANKGYRTPGDNVGTLRIYDRNKERTVAVFSNVAGYRDTSFEYMEEIAVEEGAKIWRHDEKGYMREEKVSGERRWVTPALAPATPESHDVDGTARQGDDQPF